jgi:hypothetical protein
VTLVIAAIATSFYRFELWKFLLPVAEYVRLYAAEVRHFTDGEVPLSGNRG